jgi:hypothetical protein
MVAVEFIIEASDETIAATSAANASPFSPGRRYCPSSQG